MPGRVEQPRVCVCVCEVDVRAFTGHTHATRATDNG